MAEEVDVWSSQHKRNIFQQEMQVIEMQSEAGAGTFKNFIYWSVF